MINFFTITSKNLLNWLTGLRYEIGVTTDECFQMKQSELSKDIVNITCSTPYKQRGLYKNNPDFVVTSFNEFDDTVTGYIKYTDGVVSSEYTLPYAFFDTFFRKL